MQLTKEQYENRAQEFLADGFFTRDQVEEMLCPGCGAFGFEACQPDCKVTNEWLSYPEVQRELVAHACQIAGDPNP